MWRIPRVLIRHWRLENYLTATQSFSLSVSLFQLHSFSFALPYCNNSPVTLHYSPATTIPCIPGVPTKPCIPGVFEQLYPMYFGGLLLVVLASCLLL